MEREKKAREWHVCACRVTQWGLYTCSHRKAFREPLKNTGDAGMMVHAYNSSYSGGRDLEDHSWKPA
jgi:hypothetical protein